QAAAQGRAAGPAGAAGPAAARPAGGAGAAGGDVAGQRGVEQRKGTCCRVRVGVIQAAAGGRGGVAGVAPGAAVAAGPAVAAGDLVAEQGGALGGVAERGRDRAGTQLEEHGPAPGRLAAVAAPAAV